MQYSENTNDHFLLENSVMVVKHHHHNTHPQAWIHLACREEGAGNCVNEDSLSVLNAIAEGAFPTSC